MAGRSRRRGEELMAALHEAVLAELDEVGLGRLTMEGIARRAGTPKTTLYRRWSAPEEVLLDAIAAAYPVEQPSPAADDLRGDLIAALRLMLEWSRHPTARAVRSIMIERHRHPELVTRLYRVFDRAGRRFTATVLQHYARLGHLDPALVTPVVEDIGEALVFKIAFDTGEEPSTERLAEIVDQAILPAVGIRPG
ncbi:TetR/AcrR family transcriptional regulator [Pseudonocardia sp. DSM 110487]|uniref:TetR/AcrR family transcriptional regulator n=1 Tax=Pseudonocardia sp. DSM 110487 TaxID=2865833 RepID=UPI001C6A1A20|nr:TetR/AcrR family transcriptional regulator [Pseudonocardia sp. DSM 110487]QYN34850.1 TetR/AcrR family transcriptional regulator [Pseudonocardia sp. DSM 110487]